MYPRLMLKLWAASLLLKAVLATVIGRRGGCAALRAFFWYDVLTQTLGIACSGSSPGGARLGNIRLQFPQRCSCFFLSRRHPLNYSQPESVPQSARQYGVDRRSLCPCQHRLRLRIRYLTHSPCHCQASGFILFWLAGANLLCD